MPLAGGENSFCILGFGGLNFAPLALRLLEAGPNLAGCDVFCALKMDFPVAPVQYAQCLFTFGAVLYFN